MTAAPPAILLVHAPLLAPVAWRPCARLLAAAGHRVAVPDLRPTVHPPAGWWDRAAEVAAAAGAAAAGAGRVIVAGHSGAGPLLPSVADRLPSTEAVVFVDAVLPALTGNTRQSARFASFVAGLPVEQGLLPQWSRWWGDAAMAELLPDPRLREELAAQEPRLRPDFWAEPVPVPAGWAAMRAGYLQLSAAYQAEAAEAARRGWPVRSLPGEHLDLLRRPAEVAAELVAVARATA